MVKVMTKKIVTSIVVNDEKQLLDEIVKLVDLRWSLMVDRKVTKANKISDQLYKLERHIPSLPDKGRRLLMQLAESPKEELRIKAAFHLIPLEPAIAKKLLEELAENARNAFIGIEADTTLGEWKKGRLDYYCIMNLSADGKRLEN
jgi:hypothetical protein